MANVIAEVSTKYNIFLGHEGGTISKKYIQTKSIRQQDYEEKKNSDHDFSFDFGNGISAKSLLASMKLFDA